STTTRPRSLNLIDLPSSAWVPTTMSIWPSAMPALTRLSSAEDTSLDAWPICTGNPLNRSIKVLVCWRANSVVGTTTATCLPPITAAEKLVRHTARALCAAHDRSKGGAERDFGLTEADVAADQPVHRASGRKI